MRLSYSEQALGNGCGEPALASVLQQPRQMSSRAHVEPLRDPRQRHRRLRAQLPGQLDLPRLALPPRPQVSLAPAHPVQPLHHPPLGLPRPPPLHHLPQLASAPRGFCAPPPPPLRFTPPPPRRSACAASASCTPSPKWLGPGGVSTCSRQKRYPLPLPSTINALYRPLNKCPNSLCRRLKRLV